MHASERTEGRCGGSIDQASVAGNVAEIKGMSVAAMGVGVRTVVFEVRDTRRIEPALCRVFDDGGDI